MTDSPAPGGSVPMRSRVRLGPALVVLAIVGLVIIGGSLLALIPGSSKSKTPSGNVTGARGSIIVDGTQFVSASPALSRIGAGGVVPSDVSSTLYLPKGAEVTSTENLDNGNGPFDRSLTLSSGESARDLAVRETILLGENGWRVTASREHQVSKGQESVEVLAEHPGSDGYYWEAGVTVVPVLREANGHVNLTLRLLQVPDGN